MKDIRLSVKAYNNRLVTLREQLGVKTKREMAKRLGVQATTYGSLESMKVPPINRKEEWTTTALKIADYFKVPPEEVFPAFLQRVRARSVEILVDSSSIPALQGAGSVEMALPPSELYDETELKEMVRKTLGLLTPREEAVLRLRLGIGGGDEHTLKETGGAINVTQERVRQIEAKALRKLRYPSTRNKLKPWSGCDY